jgi:hypothetical protein
MPIPIKNELAESFPAVRSSIMAQVQHPIGTSVKSGCRG